MPFREAGDFGGHHGAQAGVAVGPAEVWSDSVVGTYHWSLNVQSGSVSRNQKPLEATRSHSAGDPGLPRVKPINPAQASRCWRVGTRSVAPGTSPSLRAVLPRSRSRAGPQPLTAELRLKEEPGPGSSLQCSLPPGSFLDHVCWGPAKQNGWGPTGLGGARPAAAAPRKLPVGASGPPFGRRRHAPAPAVSDQTQREPFPGSAGACVDLGPGAPRLRAVGLGAGRAQELPRRSSSLGRGPTEASSPPR